MCNKFDRTSSPESSTISNDAEFRPSICIIAFCVFFLRIQTLLKWAGVKS